MTIPTAEDVAPLLLKWCQAQSTVEICVLFGSVAKNTAREASDIDVALWCKTKPEAQVYLGWLSELSLASGFEVSVVLVSAETDPVLGMEIVRHGQLIFERQPDAWALARNRLWHHYVDTEPLRRLQEQQLRNFFSEYTNGT